ncbi:CcdC protein domain-containing protein [Paenibacillus sp. TC-CSREp1]|uniref:CcdC protein domain-containing protein n=1 Tax=Paenibacillus sp. TC-CSREp1 TaxID=3410089 RepID=UPI003CF233EF
MNVISLSISLLIVVLILRGVIQGSQKPLHESGRKLLIPILYISTCLFELFDPALVLTSGRVLGSLAMGAVLSIPLILVTSFERRSDGYMYYEKNITLYLLIIVIFFIRYLDLLFMTDIDSKTMGFLNNLVALSYIGIWRIASYLKFQHVKSQPLSMKIDLLSKTD